MCSGYNSSAFYSVEWDEFILMNVFKYFAAMDFWKLFLLIGIFGYCHIIRAEVTEERGIVTIINKAFK